MRSSVEGKSPSGQMTMPLADGAMQSRNAPRKRMGSKECSTTFTDSTISAVSSERSPHSRKPQVTERPASFACFAASAAGSMPANEADGQIERNAKSSAPLPQPTSNTDDGTVGPARNLIQSA